MLASLGGDIKDLRFRDLHKLLDTGDVLVVNNTKVIPTRLFGKRDDVKVEVTLHLNINCQDPFFSFRHMKARAILIVRHRSSY